jgi:hypothetical protein
MSSADQQVAAAEENNDPITEDEILRGANNDMADATEAIMQEAAVAADEEVEEEAKTTEDEEHHRAGTSPAPTEASPKDELISPEAVKLSAEEQSNSEIEELLALLGLSQSMIQVTNEMLTPPQGEWQAPEGYRFIINPGGVGQPRDGDPRAAFMIYDTVRGFTFYRVPYDIEKTQEKIIDAGLPQYLAIRLAYGR